MADYIFGYGSLINSKSRAMSGISGDSWPVIVKGFQRFWCVQTKLHTVVGVIEEKDSVCNGVIYEANNIIDFDKREKNYNRMRLSCDSIIKGKVPKGNIWIYIPKKVQEPSKEKPIVQSYVDTILDGCLSINEKFAEDFIKNTFGWEKIFPDRKKPVYARYPKCDIKIIDAILKRFKKI